VRRKSSPGSPSCLLTENKNANYWRTAIKVGQNNVDNKCRNAKLLFVKKLFTFITPKGSTIYICPKQINNTSIQ